MEISRNIQHVSAIKRLSAMNQHRSRSAAADPQEQNRRKPRSHRLLWRALRLILAGSAMVLVAGCATFSPRNVLPEASASRGELEGFHNIRFWGDAPARDIEAIVMADTQNADKRVAPGSRNHRPISNLLAVSGGAEDGAFGAGLLVGWSETGTRPMFDLVTGVSSGALIAPFAFLGRERDDQLREIFTTYGRKDIFTYNVSGVITGAALADDTPLTKLIEKYVDEAFVREIARERMKGRILLIGTTNLDTQRPVLWDMGRIAMSESPEALALFRRILLASATLPGVFAPVRIKVRVGGQNYDELHVDGGVTRQVFVAPSVFAFVPPNQKVASRRLYVIRNGKIDPEWQPVDEKVLSVPKRFNADQEPGHRRSHRIYADQHDGIDFNLASIPADLAPAAPDRSIRNTWSRCSIGAISCNRPLPERRRQNELTAEARN